MLGNIHLSDFCAFQYVWHLLWQCALPAWQWCLLRCFVQADSQRLFPPPLLVGCGLSPGPKWLRDCNGWGDLGVAWLRVVSWLGLISEIQGVLSAKLMLQLARGQIFQQLPQITFTFHKSSCCLSSCSSALLDQVGMPPLDLLPPASAPLRRRPLRVGVFPSLSLPSLFFLPRNWSLL